MCGRSFYGILIPLGLYFIEVGEQEAVKNVVKDWNE